MNVQTPPETRTVTDAQGKSVVVGEASEETKRILAKVIEEHREALIRLADR